MLNVPAMKSLLVLGVQYPPESFLLRRYRALAARGFKVTLIAGYAPTTHPPAYEGVLWKRDVMSSSVPHWMVVGYCIQALWIACLHPIRVGRFVGHVLMRPFSWDLRGFLAHMRLFLCKEDIIHIEWLSLMECFTSLKYCIDARLVVSCRGTQFVNGRDAQENNASFISTLKRPAGIHAVCENFARTAREIREKKNSDVTTIYSGVPDPHKMPIISNVLSFCIVGRLTAIKDHELGLQALKIVRDLGYDCTLDLVGDGTDMARLRYAAMDLNIQNAVRFHGALNSSKTMEHIASSGCLILTSIHEGVANVVLEAMALGVAVISTDCGGMNEVIVSGYNGLLVPRHSAQAIADAMMHMIQNPLHAKSMAYHGRLTFLRRFTIEKSTRSWIEFYQGVIKNVA